MLLLGIVIPGCARKFRDSGSGAMLSVELDAFSGRPNPRWTLSENESASLLEALRDLPPAGPQASPDQLGFRGFIVHNLQRAGGLPSRMRVWPGFVGYEDAAQPLVFVDANGCLRTLIEQAKRRGYGAIVEPGHR